MGKELGAVGDEGLAHFEGMMGEEMGWVDIGEVNQRNEQSTYD